ncbi:MAG: energy transducer TonB [Flavobacteriales bacterium]|nr:MAG: energy transducer TonB [Flavobacteriales bacterium]
MLELSPPAPPKLEPPKPLPPQPAPKKALTPPPIMAVAKKADAQASFVVAPQPEPVAAPLVQAPVAAPVPIVAARFDADYLQNPKPVYPPMSRRLGEEGKLVLRVRVSSQGLPLSVEVSKSSGFPRLDEAGRAAVERWRFVPARQGDQAIEASVLVPLNFTLNS